MANFGGGIRASAVAAAYNGKVYVGTGGNPALQQDWWEYDIAGDAWAAMANFGGTARYEAIAVVCDGMVYLGTGNDGANTDDWWEYDIAGDAWTGDDHTMVMLPNLFVRLDGLCYGKKKHAVDISAINVTDSKWGLFGFEMDPTDQIVDNLDSPGSPQAYDTPEDAINAWPDATADHYRLCYVVVRKIGADFIGQTTCFDGVGVTSTFWSAYSLNIVNRAKYVHYYNDKLFLGNVVDTGEEFKQTIQCSVTQDFEDFSGYGSALQDLIQSKGEVMGFKQLRNKLFPYKSDSICLVETTGNYLEPIRVTEGIVRNIGLVSIRTVIDIENYHIFLTRDNIYIFDGINLQSIGDNIKNDLFSYMNMDFINTSFAFNIKEANIYVLNTATVQRYCDKAWIFDYKKKEWSHWKWGKQISSGELYYENNNSILLLGGTDGYVYKMDKAATDDSGTNISSYIMTKDYTLNEPEKLFKLLKLIINIDPEADGQDIRITASTDYGATWSNNIDITTDAFTTHIVNFFRRGRTVRLKIENISSSVLDIESLNIGFSASGFEKEK